MFYYYPGVAPITNKQKKTTTKKTHTYIKSCNTEKMAVQDLSR